MEEIVLYICRRDPIDHKTAADESGNCLRCGQPLVAILFREVKEVEEAELTEPLAHYPV